MLRPQFSLLASLCVVSAWLATASPVERDVVKDLGIYADVPNSTVAYLSDSGAIDVAALIADAAVTPVVVAALPTATIAVPDDSTVIYSSAVAEASVAATATADASGPTETAAAKRSNVQALEARAPAPAWDYGACPWWGPSPGPVLNPDTPENFRGNEWLGIAFGQTPSTGAPDGFSRVYVGADGIPVGTGASIIQAVIPLDSYDVGACKGACDYYNCQAFSTYMARDSRLDFSTLNAETCNNPPSITTFHCAIYGSAITKSMINEFGQIKGTNFQTAIAAANGYVRNDIYRDISGYDGETYPGGTTSNGYTSQFLLGVYNPNANAGAVGYSPEVCAAYCDGDVNCAGFDASQTLADGDFAGTQCLLYTTVIPKDQAYNAGQWGNDGKYYSFQPSVFYTKKGAPVTIENGGFETVTNTGATPPWTYGGSITGSLTASSVSHSGLRAAYFGAIGSFGTATYSDAIHATAGRRYTLTFWLTNARATPTAFFNVIWNGQTVYSETDQNAFAYKKVDVTVTGASTNTLQFSGRQDPSYFYLDDITLTPQ